MGWKYTFKVIWYFDLFKYCLKIFTVGTASEFRICFLFLEILVSVTF